MAEFFTQQNTGDILHDLLRFILLEVYRTFTRLSCSAGSVIRSGVNAV